MKEAKFQIVQQLAQISQGAQRRISPQMLIFVLTLVPGIVWFVLNSQANQFAHLDSLTLSCMLASVSTVIMLVSARVSVLFAFCISVAVSILTYIMFEYYRFYGAYISTETLLLFADLLTASGQFISAWILIPVLISLALILKISQTFKTTRVKKRLVLKLSSIYLASAIFGVFVQIKYDALSDRTGLTAKLELEAQNPVMFFARSSEFWQSFSGTNPERIAKHNFESLARNIIKGADLVLPEQYDLEHYKDLIVDYPTYQVTAHKVKRHLNVPNKNLSNPVSKQNVLLIVLESVRAYETSLYDSEYSITPNLDTIASQGIAAPNFYASNRQTVKGEQALLCSATDYMGDAPYAVKHGVFNGNCLPQILSKYDYDTMWFHGYTKTFFNREQYLPGVGFEQVYAKEEFIADAYNIENDIGWGVPDEYLFEKVLNKLQNRDTDKPFFAQVLTLTNHQPFDWDYGELSVADNRYSNADSRYLNYQRGIAYTDKALGQFWQKFQASELAENTIVIITADHGVPFYPNEEMHVADKREILFRIPFVIIDPKQSEAQTINTQLSQLDVAPTILSMLNIQAENAFIGRPFLGEHATLHERPILLHSANGLSLRYGELSCNPIGEMCTDSDSSCKQIGQLQCKAPNSDLFKYGHQVVHYHEYLKLALETGFAI